MAARLTPLTRIETSGGEVLKAMRRDEPGAVDIAEAYFSQVEPFAVRAWKLHTEMTVNVVVPHGHVRFVVVDDGQCQTFDLGPAHRYARLTIDPGTWFGFQGGPDGGLVLNLADVLHRPDEGRGLAVDAFDHEWTRPPGEQE